MSRTAQEIIDHADELAGRFEQHESVDGVREAVAVAAVRDASWRGLRPHAPWATPSYAPATTATRGSIGAMVGTQGEAARQRYAQSINAG